MNLNSDLAVYSFETTPLVHHHGAPPSTYRESQDSGTYKHTCSCKPGTCVLQCSMTIAVLARFSRLYAGRCLTRNSAHNIPWVGRHTSQTAGILSSSTKVLSRHVSGTPSSASTAPTTWVDRLPPKIRPYLNLIRIDKPIGTLLVFYPCGASNRFEVMRSSSSSFI